jgi:hypothetical protein
MNAKTRLPEDKCDQRVKSEDGFAFAVLKALTKKLGKFR